MTRRQRWLLTAALLTALTGVVCIIYALYIPAWAADVFGPLLVASLVPTYAFASFAATQRARRGAA